MGRDILEENPYDDTWMEGSTWSPEKGEGDYIFERDFQQRAPEVPPQLTPSQFTEFAFWMPADDGVGEDGKGYNQFSFDGRGHMRRIYDTPSKRILLKCARQVEKTVRVRTNVLMADGSFVRAEDVQVGDRVATLDVPGGGSRMSAGQVVWKSRVYEKPCVRITTRQGHVCEVATTHPMRVWDGWLEAGEVKKGTRLAAVRRSGDFGSQSISSARIRITASLLGDGSWGSNVSLVGLPGPAVEDFKRACEEAGAAYKECSEKNTEALSVRVRVGPVHDWLEQDGLRDTTSEGKFMPSWVFSLSREDTSLFINRLWATDGHVKKNTSSKYSIEYRSISRELVLQLQALLWKFGIPSKIRKNWPATYRNRGEEKCTYTLRVETQEGVRAFLRDIGALGKSEDVPMPDTASNNNRDTYPKEINDLISKIVASRGDEGRHGKLAEKDRSLRTAGLKEKLECAPTKEKLQTYVDFFRRDDRYDQNLVSLLEQHLDTDVFWDTVVSVEHVGTQKCVDFEVRGTHNFVADGFITHNSTYLGNRALCYMSLVPAFKVLYVSPSATQTKTFSADRIKDPIETSPLLSKFTTSMLSSNILEKQFVNRSKITLRYAFLNADRARGIPAYMLTIDELQDIIHENIPVIEQCLSHAPERWKQFIYAGTPKSLDNTIEYYWANHSTQNEWVVPHDCKGGEGGRFWNVLGEKNIGKKGLICSNCGTVINPMHEDSQWARMSQTGSFEGYRIPQLMVPWKDWGEILLDYKRYPRDKFYNEVLGLSYDSGMRPLTQQQLKDCCNPDLSMGDIDKFRKRAYSYPVFMGLDHGTGENSYTVVTLGTYVDSVFTIFFAHRFEGEDVEPQRQLNKIAELVDYFNVKVIGADYGGGYDRNDWLVRKFGPRRLQKFQYLAQGRNKMTWDGKLGRWKIARTELLSDLFNAIKRSGAQSKPVLQFPRWEEFKDPYGQDMLNIYSEYNNSLRKIQYKHSVDKPDDTCHSVLYCWLASMLVIPRPDVVTPVREVDGKPVFT